MKIVITGSTKGIGKAIVEEFAPVASVMILTARTAADLNSQKNELNNKFPNLEIHVFPADFSINHEVKTFGDFVNSTIESADILVNNAGIFIPGNILDEEEGTYESILSTNITSVYHLSRKLVPAMITRGKGHVFNICSVASLRSYPNGGSYSISKFALYGFTQNLRAELMDKNIKVTAIIPGATWTDSWAGSGIEENRLMQSKDIAKSIFSAYHLSDSALIEEIIMRPLKGDL